MVSYLCAIVPWTCLVPFPRQTVTSVENRKLFLPRCILRPRWRGFPLELGTGADGATGPRKKFDDIFSRPDRIHERDGWTDRQTDTGRQQRPRLRIASRGKTADWNDIIKTWHNSIGNFAYRSIDFGFRRSWTKSRHSNMEIFWPRQYFGNG